MIFVNVGVLSCSMVAPLIKKIGAIMSYYTKLSSELSDSAGARDTVSISHILSAIRDGAFPT